MASFKEKYWDWKEGWQPGVQKCETSSIMGEERSTVTVSPLVRKRSRGILQSLSCSQSSFTWYLVLAVWETLGKRRSSVKDIDCWPQCFKKWKKNWVVVGCQINYISAALFFLTYNTQTDWIWNLICVIWKLLSQLDVQLEAHLFIYLFFKRKLSIISLNANWSHGHARNTDQNSDEKQVNKLCHTIQ